MSDGVTSRSAMSTDGTEREIPRGKKLCKECGELVGLHQRPCEHCGSESFIINSGGHFG